MTKLLFINKTPLKCILVALLFLFGCQEPTDCTGLVNGSAFTDDCGECVDGNTELIENYLMDECGVCNGQGAIYECGCNEIAEGTCDCDGTIIDCNGECGGTAQLDECGICDDSPANNCVQDCEGEWGGSATIDCEGVCAGNSIIDTNGECCDVDCLVNSVCSCLTSSDMVGRWELNWYSVDCEENDDDPESNCCDYSTTDNCYTLTTIEYPQYNQDGMYEYRYIDIFDNGNYHDVRKICENENGDNCIESIYLYGNISFNFDAALIDCEPNQDIQYDQVSMLPILDSSVLCQGYNLRFNYDYTDVEISMSVYSNYNSFYNWFNSTPVELDIQQEYTFIE